MKRIARAATLALLAVVALSGCIRYNVDMTLSEDDTASGTIVIAVQKGVGEQMGVATDEEALTQLFGESPFGPNFKAEKYSEGDWVGQRYTFDAVPITELTDLASLFTVTRDGDVFSVDGEGAPVSEDDQSQMPPGAESKLSITFPGDVIEHNGTVDGTTVTWDLFTMTDPIHAKGEAAGSGAGSGVSTWLLIGGIAIVVLIGAAVAVVLLRRRGSKASADAAPVEPAPLDGDLAAAPAAVDAPPAPPAPPIAEQLAPPAPPAPPVVDQSASPETPAPPAPPAAPKQRAPRAAKPKVAPPAEGDGPQ